MAVKSTICGIMHYARQCSNAFGRNHKSQINPFKSEFFSTHVVMKYMAGDANLTVCKNFFLLFCKRRAGHICPTRLFLPQPMSDTYVPLDMKIPPCSLINHAITTQSQFIIVLHVTHRKARFAIWAVTTLATQSFCACLLPMT